MVMMVLVLRLAKLGVRVSDMVLLLLLMLEVLKMSIYEHLIVWWCCPSAWWQSMRIW